MFPLPRKRGRPKGLPKTGGRTAGVRNWTANELRDELIERSNIVEVLADVIAGKQWLVTPDHGPPKPTWRLPSGKERLSAIGLFADKIPPSLRSQEMTGKDGAPLIPTKPATALDIAGVLVNLAHDAKRRITLDEPDVHVARFRDKALGEGILPNDDESDAGPGHRAYPTPDAPPQPEPEPPPQPGYFFLLADGAAGVQMRDPLPDGREQWWISRTVGHSKPTQHWQVLERHHTSKAAAIRRVAELVERGSFGRPANVRNEPGES